MAKLIPLSVAADQLGIHERTLRRWIKDGRLKQYQIPGDRRRFVPVDDVEALREPREVPATSAEEEA